MFTYLIKSLGDNSYYTGITSNLERRLGEHNKGVLGTTKNKRPWKLVYYKEYSTYKEARKHEKWLKKKNREYKSGLEIKLDGINYSTLPRHYII